MNREQPPHDTGYKSFFSNPEMVESLLRDFVPEEFVTELDFTTLERCSGSYVTDEFVSYVRPLIQGDVSPVMVDGIPRHLYRQL